MSDENLAQALERHNGNRSSVARELGYYNAWTVSRRIRNAGKDSLLYRFKKIKGKPGGK